MQAGIEEELEQTFKNTREYSLEKIENNFDELSDSLPFVIVYGKWRICKEADWDFKYPEIPNTIKDSSAAAITTSVLVDLSNVGQDKTKAEEYKETFMTHWDTHKHEKNNLFPYQMAHRILQSLHKNNLHGCFHKPNNIAIDNSLIFGDTIYKGGVIKLIIGDVWV